MNYETFIRSIQNRSKPEGISPYLEAMYEDGIGNWDAAHELAQDHTGELGNWIHAYLHRKEGDIGNAGYWYSRAGRSMPDASLAEEWEEITRHILTRS